MELLDREYVLARFDRDPALSFQVYFYEESPVSVPYTQGDRKGIAIGVNSAFSKDRAVRDGWTDVTAVAKAPAAEEPEPAPEAPISIKEEAKKPAKKSSRKRRK